MSDDDQNVPTVTLSVEAEAHRVEAIDSDSDSDGLTGTATVPATIDATLDVGVDDLDDLISVHTAGALITQSDLTTFVDDALPDEYHVDGDLSWEWSARVDDWTDVAVVLADRSRQNTRTDSKRADVACRVLAEFAEQGARRAGLALLDVADSYDVTVEDRAAVLETLRDGEEAGDE
jgi:hypothetical protein